MTRYNAVRGGVYDNSVMVEESDGDYVWYEDVEHLEDINADLLEALEEIMNQTELWGNSQWCKAGDVAHLCSIMATMYHALDMVNGHLGLNDREREAVAFALKRANVFVEPNNTPETPAQQPTQGELT